MCSSVSQTACRHQVTTAGFSVSRNCQVNKSSQKTLKYLTLARNRKKGGAVRRRPRCLHTCARYYQREADLALDLHSCPVALIAGNQPVLPH